MIKSAQYALYMGFACTLLFTCFCRAAHMSRSTTRRDIRWSLLMLGVVSFFALVAPLVPHFRYEPDGMATALLGAIACVQVATSYHWRKGVPRQYRRPKS